jgi:Uma2 family endonuclease
MAAVIEIALDQDKEFEIVHGQLEEKPMGGAKHGGAGSFLIGALWATVSARRLGRVYGPDTSFQIGENERMPDVSFVAASRIPAEGEPEGAWPLAPDLAVEIASPRDTYEKLLTKVLEYLAAGVRQVWLISPTHRTATIYFSPRQIKVLQETDEVDGGDLIPGFRLRVGDLFWK